MAEPVTFLDARGRQIEIVGDYLDIEAKHAGRPIGKLSFDERDGHVILFGVDVKPEYQRSGIGTEMMRYAVSIHGKYFGRPRFTDVGGSHVAAEDYYTQDGAALIARCIREGILDDDPPEEGYEDYFDRDHE